MADNVLKAMADSIAQADNDLGGTLTTRLIEAHTHGGEDGTISAGVGTDILQVPTATFTAGMVDLELDLISPTNRGRYKIGAVPTAQRAQLTTLAGAPVVLADETPVVWRTGTLRVETTYGFLNPPTDTDPLGQLWVGDEQDRVTYGARTLTPTVCRFDQLGDPITGEGYLTKLQREDSEVIEARRGYSDLDKLWRAMLTAYATEEELDRIGRVDNVPRPRGINDIIYRRLLQVMPYLPRCGRYAFELVLGALYPGKTASQIRAMIWEDLKSYPCALFLLLPELQPGTVSEGRTLFNEQEAVSSSSTTAVTVAHTPITVGSVVPAPVTQELDMAVLPSAASPAWTYVNEGAAEGAAFSIDTGRLKQIFAASSNGGRYKRVTANIDQDLGEVNAWWCPSALAVCGGYPWHLYFRDGEREYVLQWSITHVMLGQLNEAVVAPAVAVTLSVTGVWHHFRLQRRGNWIRAWVDDQDLFGPIPASSFAASTDREVGFGYKNNAHSQTWTAFWDNVSFASASRRNYYNLTRSDGVFTAGIRLTSAAALFVAGDTGKLIRLYGTRNKNNGLWRATYNSATEVDLAAVVRAAESLNLAGTQLEGGAAVSGTGTAALVELEDAWFVAVDVGKTITLSASLLGNNGDVVVLEVIDPYTARVNKTGGPFVPERHLSWAFKATFDAETAIRWELVGAGSAAGAVLTLRDALPAATTPVTVTYSSVLSAQVTRDEFVTNEGSAGAVPHIYYPAYFLDVSIAIRALLSDITAAGVIPFYQRLS